MIVKGAIALAGQVIGLFGERGKATQEAIARARDNMARSWTDEFIALYWFGPSFVGWFNPERSIEIQAAMTAQPDVLAIQIAITAAVFGLGKLSSLGKR